MDRAQEFRAEKLRADIRKRIKQISCIMDKAQHITGYSQFPNVRLFYHKLEKRKKYFENALATPGGWIPFDSISRTERLTDSILVGHRLEVFAFEIEYEQLALGYHRGFFGFYHPDPFLLFGISPGYVYNKGQSGGVTQYNEVRTAVGKDPSMILRERERITAYLKKGWETCASRRNGEPFPIDLTIPEGY